MNRSAPLRLIAALLLCLALTTLLPAAMAESLPAAEQTASVLTLSKKQIVIDPARRHGDRPVHRHRDRQPDSRVNYLCAGRVRDARTL